MQTEIIILASIGVAFIAYEALRALILRRTSNVRLRLAKSGKRLLSSPDLNENQKILISNMLDDAFDWRFMAMATFTFPIVLFGYRKYTPDKEFHDFIRRDDVEEFVGLHFKAVVAVSPFFSFTFALVASLTVFLLLAFVGIAALTNAWTDSIVKISP